MTKKDNIATEIRTELNEIKKLSNNSVVMAPVTWTVGCQKFTP